MSFALLTCPHNVEQIVAYRPLLQWLPKAWVPELSTLLRVSVRGRIETPSVNGLLMDLPILPNKITGAQRKLRQVAEKIKSAGVKTVGLEPSLRSLTPAFSQYGLAVSTGLSLEIAAGIAVFLRELKVRDKDVRAVIVNPLEPPGTIITRMLAPGIRHLSLLGNFQPAIKRLAHRIVMETGTASVVTGIDPELIYKADLVVDLAGLDLSKYKLAKNAMVWQLVGGVKYNGSGVVANEWLVHLPTDLQMEGDLPPGFLRASTAETLLFAQGVELRWPKGNRELTSDHVYRVSNLAAKTGLELAGYLQGGRLTKFKNGLGFDK